MDSVDSVLMLYSYSGFPERGFALFEKERVRDEELTAAESSPSPRAHPSTLHPSIDSVPPSVPQSRPASLIDADRKIPQGQEPQAVASEKMDDSQIDAVRGALVKENTMSGLGIVLTLISILVAFRWAFILRPFTNCRSFT